MGVVSGACRRSLVFAAALTLTLCAGAAHADTLVVHPVRVARLKTTSVPVGHLYHPVPPSVRRAPAVKPLSVAAPFLQPSGAQAVGCASGSSQPAPLVALVSALKCDPDLIYEYVYNNIEYEPLYGSNKGPLGTLLDRRGNDADQVILLVTLWNIAGYSQTGYVYEQPEYTGADMSTWLGVTNDADAIVNLLDAGGIPNGNEVKNADGTLAYITINHFAAALQLGGTWYYFDPSAKAHRILSGLSSSTLASALGYSRAQFLSDASGSIDSQSLSISNVSRTSLRSDLTAYAANLISYINQNDHVWSVEDVIGGKTIRPLVGSPIRFPGSTPSSSTFPVDCPNQSPSNVECRTYITITMPGASSTQAVKLYTDQVYGHRITVFSVPSGSNYVPTLLIDGVAPDCVGQGSCTNVGPATPFGQTWSIPIAITEPNQPQNVGSFCPSGVSATECKTLTITAGGSYLISTGVGQAARGMAEYHRQLLAQARAAGNADTSEPVMGENLAAIGYAWLAERSVEQLITAQLAGASVLYNFAAGIVGQANIPQANYEGPYVDLPVNFDHAIAQVSNGPSTTIGGYAYPTAFVATALTDNEVASAFESAVLEQTQAPVPSMTAASTIKIIDANMNSAYQGADQKTYFADGTTQSGQNAYAASICGNVDHYSNSDLTAISTAVYGQTPTNNCTAPSPFTPGQQVLIPQKGNLSVGLWSGAGYTEIFPISANVVEVTQKISGGMSGGFSGVEIPDPPIYTVDQLITAASTDTVLPIIDPIPGLLSPQVLEPVDGVTGAYVYRHDDLVTGSGAFLSALPFSRTYLSSSGTDLTTMSADIGIGNGWGHTYSWSAAVNSDPYTGMGTTDTPASSAASSIAALYVMQDLLSVTPTAQTMTISSMVARWFTDQLTGNVLLVNRPNTTEEFIAAPHADGNTYFAYNAPPGSSARVTQTAPSQFTYEKKDGETLTFAPPPAGGSPSLLQSWVYPNGVAVNLNYSGSQLTQVANNLGRSLTFSYNSGGDINAVTDDTGRSVAYTYDGNHNLTGFTDPLGATTTYSYDVSGTYDSVGHLTQVFYPFRPENPYVTNWYDPLGRVAQQANGNGNVSSFYFAGSRTEIVDALGNRHVTYQTDRGKVLSNAWVLSSSFGDVFNDTGTRAGIVNITTNQYDGLDRPTYTVTPEGMTIAYTYAESPNPWANNVASITRTAKPGSPLSALTTSFTYDSLYNKPTSITDPLGLVTTMSYEPGTGNLVSIVADAGAPPHLNATRLFTYDAHGRVLTATDPLGVTTAYTYDSFENLIARVADSGGTGHLNATTRYGYDALGNRLSRTDPNGNTTVMGYDADRRLVSITAPAPFSGGAGLVKTTNAYDPDGHVITVTRANGATSAVTATTYTNTGQVRSVTDPNGNVTVNAYDADDRLSSLTDPLYRVTRYGYDAMGRRVSVTNTAIQATPLEARSYSPDGLLASLTDANGHATSFAYDGLDRLSTTTYPDSSTETLAYDADGNVLTRQTRAGATINYAYDTLNRLTTKTLPAPAPAVSYAYDLASRLTGVSDTSAAMTKPSGASASYATTISYDQLNRPLSVSWSPAPSQATPTASSTTFSYGYDATNRRVSQAATDKSWWNYPGSAVSVAYTANNLNQYSAVGSVTPTYDGNGNLTYDGGFTYCYDAESRLTGILSSGTCASPVSTVATYAYDAQGRRKEKTVGSASTVFVTDADNREVLEYDGTNGAIENWYAYGLGPDEVLNQMSPASGTRQTLIPDVQGSVAGLLDSGSGSLTRIGYQVYGANPSLASGSYRYTARRFDAETAGSTAQPSGLYYYRARMYSPAWGRFLQPDPSGYQAGNNLYAYVNNDPLNATDPLGLDCVSASGTTSCTTSAYSVSFPTPKGWQDFTSSSTNYHFYSTPANAGSANPAAVQQWVVNNPTPGTTNPATPQGALNDATPFVGGVSPINISPVQSFTTTNQANGSPVVVNVTLPGHQLFPGIVVRQVDQTSNGTVINNYGEGTSTWQSPNTFLGKEFGSDINGVWAGQVPPPK